MGSIIEELKPEAGYFPADEGNRSTFLVVNLEDASELPAIAEPWFLAWVLRRDDQVGCVLFSPIDDAETRLRKGSPASYSLGHVPKSH